MRRDRGYALITVILCGFVFTALLGVMMGRLSVARESVRAADAREAVLHAARGAVRWGEGQETGTYKRAHALGSIVVTVDAAAIRAELRGRQVTLHRANRRWEE